MPWKTPPQINRLSLAEIAQMVAEKKLPPIAQWQPQRDAQSHIRITSDGRWLHHGDPITRPGLVSLFSTILRREADGRYALVTPFERQFVEVDDYPWLAVELTSDGVGEARNLAFRLNSDELIIAGSDNPLSVAGNDNAPCPLLYVRPGLFARLHRNLYYQLVELALSEMEESEMNGRDGEQPIGIYSGARFFPLNDYNQGNRAIAKWARPA